MQECQFNADICSTKIPAGSGFKVGQHARISAAKKRNLLDFRVGQHAGMVGQHEQEWWVNMGRNLQRH